MSLDRFTVTRAGRTSVVNVDDIDWIESDGNYVSLHVGPQRHLVRGTLTATATQLDPNRFVRIHRRFIVNVTRVRGMEPWLGGDSLLLLQDGQKLRLSRNFKQEFRRITGMGARASSGGAAHAPNGSTQQATASA
jgi:two-component system LytT family response regulator